MSSTKPHHEADPQEIIDAENARNCTFKPRGLNIIWGNDDRYWKLPSKGSTDPAELVQVSWLEVTGATKNAKQPGTYEVSFKISVKTTNFGWAGCPLFMMAKVGQKGRYQWKRIKLPTNKEDPFLIPESGDKFEIKVDNTSDDSKIFFGLYEVWTGKWKGGLLIHEAAVNKKD